MSYPNYPPGGQGYPYPPNNVMLNSRLLQLYILRIPVYFKFIFYLFLAAESTVSRLSPSCLSTRATRSLRNSSAISELRGPRSTLSAI